jgi:hypothetical protein
MSRIDSTSAGATASRWTIVIASLALGVPFLLFAGLAIMLVFGRAKSVPFEVDVPKIGEGVPLAGFYSYVVAPIFLMKAVLSLCAASVGSAMFFGWPFLVLHYVVEKKIRARWPIMGDMHWAAAGSLVGLSVPYIFFGELTSGSPEAGEGIGIAAPFLFIADGILAVTGWFTGKLTWAVASFLKQRS